ncbi:MAG: hypothetical protein HYX44_10025, partial [Aquabacterium sp.]|nr:hypothetical protein [Aquabacterium sp.]
MNRYSWWKYLIIAVALFIGLIYTLPNFFGEAPAVQLSSGKATVKLNAEAVAKVESALKDGGVKADFVEFDGGSVRARFKDTDTQLKAKDLLVKAFNPDPADPHYKAFYRALAERKLPFLSHVGYEFSLIGKDQSVGDPDR